MNMITRININNIEAVKGFCKACNNLDCEVTVTSGRYSVDGKSIMGIFSLDLSENLLVEFTRELTNTEYEVFRQWEVHS